MNSKQSTTAGTASQFVNLCGFAAFMLTAVAGGLFVAWSVELAGRSVFPAVAADDRAIGLVILVLAAVVVCYRVQTTCGICDAGRRFYSWLGTGEVEVDG